MNNFSMHIHAADMHFYATIVTGIPIEKNKTTKSQQYSRSMALHGIGKL